MSNEISFETFLLINRKEFEICIIQNISQDIIYSEKVPLNNNYDELNFEKLNAFLEKKIFKIEKILKNFIKSVNIILDCKEFFSVNLSIKKDNYGNYVNSKDLINPLNDLKNLCQSNFNDKKIVHILIKNYLIDNNNYFSLPQNMKCNFFSLDVEFICLPRNLIEDLEVTFKKYHISVKQILYSKYIETFDDQNQPNIFLAASKILSGYNDNEVLLVDKTFKNKGFFEKFFNFFN